MAADPPDFKRAANALGVGGRQPGGGLGVDSGELRVHGGPTDGGGFGLDGRAHAGVGGGHLVQALPQGLEVQHRAAHQNRQAATFMGVCDDFFGVGHKTRCRVGFSGLDDVDQMVGHGLTFSRCGLGRADVQAAINLG